LVLRFGISSFLYDSHATLDALLVHFMSLARAAAKISVLHVSAGAIEEILIRYRN